MSVPLVHMHNHCKRSKSIAPQHSFSRKKILELMQQLTRLPDPGDLHSFDKIAAACVEDAQTKALMNDVYLGHPHQKSWRHDKAKSSSIFHFAMRRGDSNSHQRTQSNRRSRLFGPSDQMIQVISIPSSSVQVHP